MTISADEKLTVLNPVGYPPKITPKALAPRLESLDGKTVYLVDPRFDDSGLFLRQVQSWFADHMPTVKTKFVEMNNVYTKDDPKTWEKIKADGDAAIIGVGH
ncbi:MAG: hypothetical protein EXR70_16160 [Deltaproteobacteria bacterium]|nr:hypothetical protein [Deltaproteobacteria bacterium]